MSAFEDIRRALLDLVTTLPSMNRESRKEIREVILELESELERSINLAVIYLEGTYRIKPEIELIDHLANAPSRLMDTFNQFKICAGIYGLSDKFNQIFDPTRLAVNAGKSQKIANLLQNLMSGERMIIDILRDTTEFLADSANDLRTLSGAEFNERRDQLQGRIELEVKELKSQIKLVRSTVKDVLVKM